MPDLLLGEGSEGSVYRQGNEVVKIFKGGVISDEMGLRLVDLVKAFRAPFPENVWLGKEGDAWVARYPWFESEPVHGLVEDEIVEYLIQAGSLPVIADNFKLTNLRRRDGQLVHIDVGRHIREFNRSTFRDVCAKAYALLQGMSEHRLVSDFSGLREAGGVEEMPGFTGFYGAIVRRIAEDYWKNCPLPVPASVAEDVTLLLKCCAMDSSYLERQVGHIVHRLSMPRRFREVVLSIDTKVGAFLRQHSAGDLDAVRISARRLVERGEVERVIEAPSGTDGIDDVNSRWFGVACAETHTAAGMPVYPQLWAFEQIRTTYVLQADCDVLICRHDFSHDYLSEMIAAHGAPGVVGVGFNIPQSLSSPAKEYVAPVGEYKPEVRLGLFDLPRLKRTLPWPNLRSGPHLGYGWYQALHQAMNHNGWRCLRGGDPRTAYIHPLNSAKQVPGFMDKVRRCVESGFVPEAQHGKWDLVEDTAKWAPSCAGHEVIIALVPTHCSRLMAERCVSSLAGQSDRGFGIVVLEDDVAPARTAELVALLNIHGLRAQVVSNLDELRRQSAEAPFVLTLRSDEALMSANAVVQLKLAAKEGRMAQGGCFCDSDALRRSDRYGLGRMYDGEVTKPLCRNPRCFIASSKDIVRTEGQGCHTSCVTFDVFAETPSPGGNRRPSVMAGFVVWKEQGGRPSR